MEYARFDMCWSNLNNLSKGFLGMGKKRMTVWFQIGRQIPGTDNFAMIYQSEPIKQESADFDIPIILSMEKLCNNDRDTNVRFSVWNKRNEMINQVQTTVNEILGGTTLVIGKENAMLNF